MAKNSFVYLFTLILLATSACSSSKWVVESQEEIDRNDFELLDSDKFLERNGMTTPENPVISYRLKAANTFEYVQRVRTDRYIQRYKPSFKSVMLGLIGSGLATTAALTIEQSNTSKNILFGTAGLVAFSSFLNLQPSGTPTPTGESRLLRKTGTIEETEIVDASPSMSDTPLYSVIYKNQALVSNQDLPFIGGQYRVNLVEDLNPETFEYDSSDFVSVQVVYNAQSLIEKVPLRNIFEPFVVVSSEVTALRDEPELDSRNILTDLAQGSQMKLVEETEQWYKVLYGISETWISKSDAYPIWRPSEFAQELSIIAIPNVPFGNVDVESNIPELSDDNDETYAILVSVGEYQGDITERIYAERDLRLMEAYLEQSLGLPSQNLVKAINIENQQQLRAAYNRLAAKLRTQKKRLVVYLSGYATEMSNNRIGLLPVNPQVSSPLDINSLLSGLSSLNTDEIVVFSDLDFESPATSNDLLANAAAQVTNEKPESLVIFGSTSQQRSRNYSVVNGEQKRHSIFTYFLADAIKKGESNLSGIINHLQRNVDYTSRRLHNQPQHIIYFGDNTLSLID